MMKHHWARWSSLLLLLVLPLVLLVVILVATNGGGDTHTQQQPQRQALEKYTPDKTNTTSCTHYYRNGTTTVYTWDPARQYYVQQPTTTMTLRYYGNLPPPCRQDDDAWESQFEPEEPEQQNEDEEALDEQDQAVAESVPTITTTTDTEPPFTIQQRPVVPDSSSSTVPNNNNVVRVAVSIALPPFRYGHQPGDDRYLRQGEQRRPEFGDHRHHHERKLSKRREWNGVGMPVRVAQAVTSLFNRTSKSAVYLYNHANLTAQAHALAQQQQQQQSMGSDTNTTANSQQPAAITSSIQSPPVMVPLLLDRSDDDDDDQDEQAMMMMTEAIQTAAQLVVQLMESSDVLPNQTMYFFLKPSKHFQRLRPNRRPVWEFFHDDTIAERVFLPTEDDNNRTAEKEEPQQQQGQQQVLQNQSMMGVDDTTVTTTNSMHATNTTAIPTTGMSNTGNGTTKDTLPSTSTIPTTNRTDDNVPTVNMTTTTSTNAPIDNHNIPNGDDEPWLRGRALAGQDFDGFNAERAYNEGVYSSSDESSDEEDDASNNKKKSNYSYQGPPQPAIWWKHTLEYRCYQRNQWGTLQPLTQVPELQRIEQQLEQWMRFHVETTSGVDYALRHGHVQGVAMPGEEYPIMMQPSYGDGEFLDDDLYNEGARDKDALGTTFTEPLPTGLLSTGRMREWFGLGLLVATVAIAGLLTAMAQSRMIRRQEQDLWGAIGTEEALEEMLNVGWRINHVNVEMDDDGNNNNNNNNEDGGGETLSGWPLPPPKVRQQPVLEIFDKGRVGYQEDDSVLLGDARFATE